MVQAFNIPPKIRAATCTNYGEDVDDVLSVQDNAVATPRIGDQPPAGFKNAMLIRVLAVALAPGDVRVMSGKTREFQGPPSFPYTPGGDVCGVVAAVPKEEEKKNGKKNCRFRVGDRIAARFVNKPMGMLGEYALVSTDVCDIVPDGISAEGAAALASSGTCAVKIAGRIQEGDRVLIFGAGGGVGSHLCQLVRLRGASYVAGVGRDPRRLMDKPLGCDLAIDYTQTDPFAAMKEWMDDPFDVIVDLSSGVWPALVAQKSVRGYKSIVKPASKGGRYLTTTPDKPSFKMRSAWDIVLFLIPPLWRALSSRCGMSRFSLPTYSYVLALPETPDVVTETLRLASEDKLVPCIDAQGPFPFTTDGVRDAFRLQASRHAKGKVIISVAKK
mmetsp:Transcript_6714/g.16531  ORF Transcript_6714/g.16531 Transcript_6714/m.16531 type:complete len:386 (-) Transcript_6714:121-1278(-)|eukprot:CAMPEP_0181100782 /NCGR_PEP_ID=MMETSP1071-20121207/13382_1 /TAXON_ID=35127 /ORGANISM="Thalassiosira sp., Strain NH16" /LENGTH=385 /DNA_ID=CAMNT_0023183545 /DNA_START=164 /DNA_END=1321 /DNA_ORIENTATION=-